MLLMLSNICLLQNVSSVHGGASDLKTEADASKYTPEYLEKIKENTTSLQSSTQRHINSCKNYSQEAQSADDRSQSAKAESAKASTVARNARKEVDRIMVDMGRLQKVNTTGLRELQDRIKRIRETYTAFSNRGYNVTDIVNKLKDAKKEQDNFLAEYKQKVKERKKEIQELTQLHDSLHSVSCR